MYAIPTANIEKLADAFNKLAKRASKLGVTAPTYSIVSTEMVTRKSTGIEYEVSIVDVTLEIVKFDGWQLVAVVDHNEAGNIFKMLPGAYDIQVPETYRHVGTICEHCGKNRNRTDTYIVMHDDGSFKQVGKSCLKDFTGHKNPEAIAAFLTILDDILEDEELYADDERINEKFDYVNTKVYLAHVSAMIREKGWMSSGKARDLGQPPTREFALFNLVDTFKGRKDVIKLDDSDFEIANQAYAWINDPATECSNEYMTNLRIACSNGGSAKIKLLGFVASLIPAYQKAMGYEAEKKQAQQVREYVGQVKGKVKVQVTVTGKKYIESFYGTTVLHNFVDTNGNQMVWFSSNDTDCSIGDTVNLTGSVKEHKEYNGVKQTVLTRCKLSA